MNNQDIEDTTIPKPYNDIIQSFEENGYIESHVEMLGIKSDPNVPANYSILQWAVEFATKVKATKITYIINDEGIIKTIEIRR